MLLAGLGACAGLTGAPHATLPPQAPVSQRDPLKWPFSQGSIWNRPVGSEAVYIPAGFSPASMTRVRNEADILILKPEAGLVDIFYNGAGWNKKADRCGREGALLASVPIPDGFVISQDGITPNNAAAILMPDGRTLKQTQPFQRCQAGGYATSLAVSPDVDLCGDGIRGAHGGSGLSSIGGTIRLGELVPGGVIRHALKLNVYAKMDLYYGPDRKGFRWPALKSDGYAGNPDSPKHYGGTNRAVVMGSLLALRPEFWVNELHSEPARILARALQAYGAYIADDTTWDALAIATETSPDGQVVTEFKQTWGFDFNQSGLVSCKSEDPGCAWGQDLRTIYLALQVVDNNSPEGPSGGGEALAPWAPVVQCR